MSPSVQLTRRLPDPRRILAWLGCLVVVVNVALMFQPTMVVGHSMEPSLQNGKLIWIDRAYYHTHKPQRGEVIVFKYLDGVYVKRVYRTAGETIHTLEASSASFTPIREGREQEIAARFGRAQKGLRVREVDIPEDHVFVLGDNYFDSIDSRVLGPIPVDSILGRAMVPVDPTIALSHEIAPPPLDKDRASRQVLRLVKNLR
jgi:signal peptidase I